MQHREIAAARVPGRLMAYLIKELLWSGQPDRLHKWICGRFNSLVVSLHLNTFNMLNRNTYICAFY